MADDNSLIININGSAKDFLNELEKVKKSTKDTEKILSATAKASAIAFAGFAAGIALVTKEFINFETALVGVGKTTNIEGKKLEAFGKQFQKLSTEIPLSTNELLGIAQAAGQLGVTGEKNLLKFTETIAKLGVATDLSGEEAATALTRILNVTNEGIETIDTFGSVIVALGNNFAATESEIVKVANEVARSTTVFGVSAGEAAGLAAALKSVGIQAQLGGSVVGKAMLKIQKAIDGGGKTLEQLSELTGIAGDQLKQTFADDATGTFQKFIEGLGNLEGGTSAMFEALNNFGLKGDEVNKVLPVLAQNSALVGKALKLQATETKNATALNIEAEKAYATLGSEKEKLINTATNLLTLIGKELAPTIKSIIVDTRKFLTAIQEMDSELISNIATFLKWGAIISGAVASVTAFLLGAIKVSAIITSLTAAFGPATLGASAFWVALTGPIGLAVAGVVAVTAAVAGLIALTSKKKEEPETLQSINRELDKLKKSQQELKNGPKFSFRNQKALDDIGRQIKKLEELKKAKQDAGELLLRPEVVATASGSLGADAFGFEDEQVLPFKPQAELEAIDKADDDKSAEKLAEKEKAKTDVVDEETKKRIAILKTENSNAKEIQEARAAVETEEEKNLAQRKTEIQQAFTEAAAIKNAEESALTLESLRLKHSQELEEIKVRNEEIAAERAADVERRKELETVLREEGIANADELAEEDLERLSNKLLTEQALEDKIKLAQAEKVVKERNKFLTTKTKYNETIAQVDKIASNEKVQAASALAGRLLSIAKQTGQENTVLGKAAALTQIAINTPEAASSNYKFASALGGPIAGSIAAGVALAFGAKQAEQVLAANKGGQVPSSLGTSGVDSVPAMLTPGELVVPAQNFDEVVNATADARGDGGSSASSDEDNMVRISIEPKGDLIDFIEQQIIERRVQGVGIL